MGSFRNLQYSDADWTVFSHSSEREIVGMAHKSFSMCYISGLLVSTPLSSSQFISSLLLKISLLQERKIKQCYLSFHLNVQNLPQRTICQCLLLACFCRFLVGVLHWINLLAGLTYKIQAIHKELSCNAFGPNYPDENGSTVK